MIDGRNMQLAAVSVVLVFDLLLLSPSSSMTRDRDEDGSITLSSKGAFESIDRVIVH